MDELKKLFENAGGDTAVGCEPLNAGGSNRKYFRIRGKTGTAVGVEGTVAGENNAFLKMAEHFTVKNLNTPRIIASSPDKMYYLQTDLGNVSLFDFIAEGRKTGIFSESEKEMLHTAIGLLPSFQMLAADFDFSESYPVAEFDRRSVFWDLNYFKYNFLKTAGEFQENDLEDDFERLAVILLKAKPQAFMYRDFQSRNVMIDNGTVYFIDFQGGRKGALHYDVASFLWQAKANFSPETREELLGTYLKSLGGLLDFDEEEFRHTLNYFVLFRILQTLGAYGFRGYFEQKAHFVQSISPALKNLKYLLQNNDFGELPYLTEILNRLTGLPKFKPVAAHEDLKVRVFSFSYKKGGVPADVSGNGGGFVFDCRAIHNPGRYGAYRNLTGLDTEVARFLETESEMPVFLRSVYALADMSVRRYTERGFTDLMISFGCTGGQHRSVYAAQKTAEHLREKFGIETETVHREIQE